MGKFTGVERKNLTRNWNFCSAYWLAFLSFTYQISTELTYVRVSNVFRLMN